MSNEINQKMVSFFKENNILSEGGFYLDACSVADSGMAMHKTFEGELDEDGFNTMWVIAFEIKENEKQDDLRVYSNERLVSCYQVG